ncbi:hypothetical protein HY333_00685 [Candidatus Collierbacteria bacterium]|nr:hypothetical protein [Candidatus Collierbacteria bacterium]
MKINLLKGNLRHNQISRLKKINRIMTLVGGGLFMGLIVFMSGQFVYLKIRLNKVAEDELKLRGAYESRLPEIQAYSQTVTNLREIGKILEDRFDYSRFMAEIVRLLPEGMSIAGMNFAEKSIISLSTRTSDLLIYQKFIDKISQDIEGLPFVEASQKSFERGDDGSYLIQLELRIKPEKI